MTAASREADRTRKRYNRIAPIYNALEWVVEHLAFRAWRAKLWSYLGGEQRVLEVGVGTGKNFPYHPADVDVVGLDLSERMLAQARQKRREMGTHVPLVQLDAQRMAFADDIFDAAVATFVFCSVPDPVQGLREIRRVVRPGGQVILLEHVRVNAPLIGPLMDLLDPLVVRVMGAHIKRQTEENVRRAGLDIVAVESLTPGALVKLIRAQVT
jgi:ubiquinone/menaquinone biosynthesis C-methylase UbiE